MDDLMAGLDASLFDNVELSPVKSQKPKREVCSPVRPTTPPIQARSPLRRAVKLESPRVKTEIVKQEPAELCVPELQAVPLDDTAVKSEKPDLEDDIYDFDLDLSAVVDWDDEVLTKPQVQVRTALSGRQGADAPGTVPVTASRGPCASARILPDAVGAVSCRGGLLWPAVYGWRGATRAYMARRQWPWNLNWKGAS